MRQTERMPYLVRPKLPVPLQHRVLDLGEETGCLAGACARMAVPESQSNPGTSENIRELLG